MLNITVFHEDRKLKYVVNKARELYLQLKSKGLHIKGFLKI